MREYTKSIIPMIEANYDRFTDTEKIVGNFFLQNVMPKDLSSKYISKKLSISEATLSRFAQKCGYEGYRQFIFEYKNTYIEHMQIPSIESMQVLQTYQTLLNKIYNLVNMNQIKKITSHLKKSRNVYICGRGSSGLAAEEMMTRFRWIGVNALAIRDNENMKMQTVFLGEKDCVIGISLSGTKSEVLYMLEKGHLCGSKTILITEKKRDEYDFFCDEVILVPSLDKLNQGNLISPQFPILLLIDIIYADYVNSDRKRIEDLQDKIQHALLE